MISEDRPSWKETWFAVANTIRQRATCNRLKVGAVVVSDDNQILSTGYNGAPRGVDHCLDVGCFMEDGHCIRSAHAEENAVNQAARQGISLFGSTAYITVEPCVRCTRMLLQAGIKHIFVSDTYKATPNEMKLFSREMMRISNVTYEQG